MTDDGDDVVAGDGDPDVDGTGSAAAARRATVRTTHDRPAVVAAAVEPDDTEEMDTRVEGDAVVSTIRRTTTGGLAATVDDYVVNVAVAERTARHAERFSTRP